MLPVPAGSGGNVAVSCAFTSAVLGRREHFPLHTETLRASRTTGVTAGVSQEDGEQAGPDGQEKGKVAVPARVGARLGLVGHIQGRVALSHVWDACTGMTINKVRASSQLPIHKGA